MCFEKTNKIEFYTHKQFLSFRKVQNNMQVLYKVSLTDRKDLSLYIVF